jgi:uncharacterized membrane protein
VALVFRLLGINIGHKTVVLVEPISKALIAIDVVCIGLPVPVLVIVFSGQLKHIGVLGE